MLNWSAYNLPSCFLVGSAGEKVKSFWTEDPAEAGPARRRARFSRSLREWPSVTTGPIKSNEIDKILEFYNLYCAKGTRSFWFPSQRRRGGAVEMVYVRFLSMPEIVPINSLVYNVSFGLEEV